MLLCILSKLSVILSRSRDEDGQTLAEYSLIITAIAVALVVVAVLVFRDALTGAFNSTTACLDGVC